MSKGYHYDVYKEMFIACGCGDDVYSGEGAIYFDGKWICPACFEEKIEELLRDKHYGIYDLARMMNCEVKMIDDDIERLRDFAYGEEDY